MNAVGIRRPSLRAIGHDRAVRCAPDDGRAVSLIVAIDAGPLHGPRTGIGNAVDWTLSALRERPDLELRPYVTSARATVRPPERRLPIPAAVALRVWARSSSPPVDRWLGHPDVVHGTNYVVPPTRCARVVTVYDCWFLEHPDGALPDVRRAATVLRRAVSEGAHVITSSDATSRRVRSLLDTDRVTTILLGPPPPPIDDAPAAPPPGLPDLASESFILALGTIERRKNLPTLVAAFGRVAREHPTVSLVMAGAVGNDAPAVDRAIARLDPAVAARVVRIGAVSHEAKRWLLQHARALAYPSLDEGFGFPILEAQQYGTPVVASTAGSIPQVTGPSALLSAPLDADALAANLYWVVTNDEMHAKLVRRARTNLARFSWDETARRVHETYLQVVETHQVVAR